MSEKVIVLNLRKVIACFLLMGVFLTGCADLDAKNSDYIEFVNQNFYDLNWEVLNENILKRIQVSRDQISMPFMYDEPAIDILFDSKGNIMSFHSVLWVNEFSTDNEYTMAQYAIEDTGEKFMITYQDAFLCDQSKITSLHIQCRENGLKFEKQTFKKYFDVDQYIKNTNWLYHFSFASVINKYVKESSVRLRFLAGPILKEIITDSNVSVTMLNCTSTGYYETNHKLLQDFENPNLQYALFEEYLDNYFVVIPYYVQDGSLKGVDEKTFGQGNDKTIYIANDIILLFLDN